VHLTHKRPCRFGRKNRKQIEVVHLKGVQRAGVEGLQNDFTEGEAPRGFTAGVVAVWDGLEPEDRKEASGIIGLRREGIRCGSRSRDLPADRFLRDLLFTGSSRLRSQEGVGDP
jgi:hypothetical protein